MINLVFRNIVSFVALILFQVLILNNLHLSILVNPYTYILFIFMLPFDTPGWLLLTLAFVSGLIMDAFSNTLGMHMSALLITAFCRHYLLAIMAPRDGYESGQTPHYSHMGLTWFLLYAGILTLLFHFSLFLTEDFRWGNFFIILFKSVISSALSLIIMSILLLTSHRPRR
jgi:rod shape-determining protein MreD